MKVLNLIFKLTLKENKSNLELIGWLDQSYIHNNLISHQPYYQSFSPFFMP